MKWEIGHAPFFPGGAHSHRLKVKALHLTDIKNCKVNR